jgi:hypothetical protein
MDHDTESGGVIKSDVDHALLCSSQITVYIGMEIELVMDPSFRAIVKDWSYWDHHQFLFSWFMDSLYQAPVHNKQPKLTSSTRLLITTGNIGLPINGLVPLTISLLPNRVAQPQRDATSGALQP